MKNNNPVIEKAKTTIKKTCTVGAITMLMAVAGGNSQALAEQYIELPRQAVEVIQQTRQKAEKTRADLVRSTKPQKEVYTAAMQKCLAAPENSAAQDTACNEAANEFVELINVQVAHIERYDGDLGSLQDVFDMARENARPAEGDAPGSAKQIEAFNRSVSNMESWDQVLKSVDKPGMQNTRRDIRKLYAAFRQEVQVAKANKNRLSERFLDLYAEIIHTNRLMIDSYVRQVEGILQGTLKAQQAGTVVRTFAALGQVLNGIDRDIVPPFLNDMGRVLNIIARGQSSNPYEVRNNAELNSMSDFLIQD